MGSPGAPQDLGSGTPTVGPQKSKNPDHRCHRSSTPARSCAENSQPPSCRRSKPGEKMVEIELTVALAKRPHRAFCKWMCKGAARSSGNFVSWSGTKKI